MALSFFRALDPTSNQSGIVYIAGPSRGAEITDLTVSENIDLKFNDSLNFIQKLWAINDVIVGEHYTMTGIGLSTVIHIALSKVLGFEDIPVWFGSQSQEGSKGILDYLILPLVARKILAESLSAKLRNPGMFLDFLISMSMGVAFALEAVRFSAGIGLTLLAVPVVLLVEMVEALQPDVGNSFINLGM